MRPESWTRPASASPVWVIAGEPGSRPRFVVERQRAAWGVESLFGGSRRTGRSVMRYESCSLVTVTAGEPSHSCHGEGPCPTCRPVPEMPLVGSLRGQGSGTYATVWFVAVEARLSSLANKDRSHKPAVRSSGGKREPDRVMVLMIAARSSAGGKDPDFGHAGSGIGRRDNCVTMPRRPSVSCARANCMHSSRGGCWKRSKAVRSTAGPRSVR